MKGREKEEKWRHIIIYTRAYACAREKKKKKDKLRKRKKEILKLKWERF